MLDRDLEEADEQHQMALRSHLQNVDELVKLQRSRLLAMEQQVHAIWMAVLGPASVACNHRLVCPQAEKDLALIEDEFKHEFDDMKVPLPLAHFIIPAFYILPATRPEIPSC